MGTDLDICGLIACQIRELIKCFMWHPMGHAIDQETSDKGPYCVKGQNSEEKNSGSEGNVHEGNSCV